MRSSEPLMEKPTNGKCRCRNQSWYFVLISFLLWFSLFYLYSSSITFGKIGGDSFLGNNQTDFVETSESIRDVARYETEDVIINGENVEQARSEGTDKEKKGENVEEVSNEGTEKEKKENVEETGNEGAEKEKKPDNDTVDMADRHIDLDELLGVDNQTRAEENEPEPEPVETISGKVNEDDQLSNEDNDRPIDTSSVEEQAKEEVTKQKGINQSRAQIEGEQAKEEVTKQKGINQSRAQIEGEQAKEEVTKQKGVNQSRAQIEEEQAKEEVTKQKGVNQSRAQIEEEKAKEEVTKQKRINQSRAQIEEEQAKEELPREQIEDQSVADPLPIVKSRKERARQYRRINKNKPVADSSNVEVELPRTENEVKVVESDPDPCAGRYVYIHNIPRKFNQDLLDDCRKLSFWTDMCECSSNLGLGAALPINEKLYSRTGWFNTNQFLVEVIFHNRMKQYKCLTKDPFVASAIYVPYYAGLDVGRYLWDNDGFMRNYDALNIVRWLASRPEWKKMWGRDHFLVAGRINWDFRRDHKNESDWGNELLNLPESRNMTNLVIESSPWNYNDFGIPYPTYFHPASDVDVFQWQNRMRREKRRILFSFAGARRPNLHESIRNEVIDQCLASRRKCKFLECDKTRKCHKPEYLMKLFQSSIFCLQPPGDSYTRRSIFDSILAGCIPVFFHPGSAYVQYIWHLPKNFGKYSVLIPANDVKSGNAKIEKILQKIPRDKRVAMREEVIKLIPKVTYADPSSRLETIEDAFDITIKGVLDRVETVRNQMKEGKEVNSEFDEEESWKYFAFEKLGVHEWDPFFMSKLGKLGA